MAPCFADKYKYNPIPVDKKVLKRILIYLAGQQKAKLKDQYKYLDWYLQLQISTRVSIPKCVPIKFSLDRPLCFLSL